MQLMILIIFLVVAYYLYGFYQSKTRESFIRSFDFPQGMHRRLGKHHPNLTADQFQLVADSLRQFFLVHKRSGRSMVAMPSQVTDDLWHEFILYTQAYQTFCKKAFGHFFHHTPAAAMTPKQKKSNAGLQQTWLHACQLDNINPRIPVRLPLIFAIDAQLNIANGFHYVTDCKKAGLVAGSGATAIYCGGDFASATSCSGSSNCAGDGDSSCSGDSGCGGGGD